MSIKQIFRYCLLLVMIILSACHTDERDTSFIQYIPDIKHGKSELLEAARALADSLGLDNLEKGYDSLQIRIWFNYDRKDTFQVLSIKRNNAKWYGSFCVASYQLNENQDSLARYFKITFEPERRDDWGVIVDSLVQYHIMTLPDQHKVIPIDAYPFDGGNGVMVEVADAHQYRIYGYELSSLFKERFKEVAEVGKIVNFLSNRLGIRYLGAF